MTDEPTYTYIRGQGWVPNGRTWVWETRTFGRYNVTIELRKPELRERYWTISPLENLNILFDYVKQDYDSGYLSTEYGTERNPDYDAVATWSDATLYCVFTVTTND